MPVFAIANDGDFWELRIAFSGTPSAVDDNHLDFLGPFDMGNTKTCHGMFQVVDVLCCLVKWGLGEYWGWVDSEVLSKYRPVTSVGKAA